ncbi:MAG: recombination protein RecR [Clostridia bacterium]|nr:recombination protein RecR [Clostridia bacterium]MBR2944971.1 recombination protein RecR [Clostridia bacterium]
METFIKPLNTLIEKFRSLDGVGKKSAMRMAFSVLDMENSDAYDFAQAILDAKTQIGLCSECQNLSSEEICPICSNDARDHSVICVVEDYQAVLAFEKVKEFRGVYHVLHGTISPMKSIGPDQLKIKELLARINNSEVKEIIVATNYTVEGEATAMYLSKILKPLEIKVTRLANGLPVGSDLEYADEVTLYRALLGRRDI